MREMAKLREAFPFPAERNEGMDLERAQGFRFSVKNLHPVFLLKSDGSEGLMFGGEVILFLAASLVDAASE
jgi:hypothetical protein